MDFLNKTVTENDRLKEQLKELKAERKGLVEKERKAEHLNETIKKYENEREVIKEKIESLINQIDQLGL